MTPRTARILIVDDEPDFLVGLRLTLLQEGYESVTTQSDPSLALGLVRSEPWDLVILDLTMPGIDGKEIFAEFSRAQPGKACIILTAIDDASHAAELLCQGALRYLTKPVAPAEFLRAVRFGLPHVAPSIGASAADEVVASSPQMACVFDHLRLIAPTNECVLILGETGTGKELLARAVHRLSSFSSGPYVAVNAAAIPGALFSSLLFGHRAGAFTGAAKTQPGFLDAASGGTLFLDEIGTLERSLQALLLRVLDERSFYALGEATPTTMNARLVFATNRDLEAEVAAGRFRADLYYRLGATSISLPPLSARSGDIALLAQHFVLAYARSYQRQVRGLCSATLALLERHPWKGNVRELKNVVKQAVLKEESALVRPSALPSELLLAAEGSAPDPESLPSLSEIERDHIFKALDLTGGSRTYTAQVLGISRATLCRRLKQYKTLNLT